MKALDITKLNEVSPPSIFALPPSLYIIYITLLLHFLFFKGFEGGREFLFVPGFWILPLRVYPVHQYLGGYLLSFSMISA